MIPEDSIELLLGHVLGDILYKDSFSVLFFYGLFEATSSDYWVDFDLSSLIVEALASIENVRLVESLELDKAKTEEFLELPFNGLQEILRSDYLNSEETDIWNALIRWLEHKETERIP